MKSLKDKIFQFFLLVIRFKFISFSIYNRKTVLSDEKGLQTILSLISFSDILVYEIDLNKQNKGKTPHTAHVINQLHFSTACSVI